MLIVDLSLASVVQHSPFAFSYTVQVISHVSHAQCPIPKLSLRSYYHVHVYVHDDHYLTH